MSKRFLSLFTALALCFSLLPVSALAEKDKTVVNGYVSVITNVKVMEHTHSFSAGKCGCRYTCPHSNGITDNRCNDCNAEIAASILGNKSETRFCTDLQDAIDIIDNNDIYTIDLLADANGSYVVTMGKATTFRLNGKTINDITFSGDAKMAFNGRGNVNNVTFKGSSARFNAGDLYLKIKKLNIADGATWKSILPGENYGYDVYSDDQNTHTWYDADAAEDKLKTVNSISNVIVNSLPIISKPTIKLGGEILNSGDILAVDKDYTLGVESTYDAVCFIHIQKQGSTDIKILQTKDNDSKYYECETGLKYGISEMGTYEIWAEVTKDRYTRKSEKYTFAVARDITAAEVTVGSLTYNGKPQTPEITVKIGEETLEKDKDYTVSVTAQTGAGTYTLTVVGKGSYAGKCESVPWTIKKRAVTIANKEEDGYKTDYMYGNRILEPKETDFDITGSEPSAIFSYRWIGEEPKAYSGIGKYELEVFVSETDNTAGGSLKLTVEIKRNTNSEFMNGTFYDVYNNSGTVLYEIDYIKGKRIDAESLKLHSIAVKVRENDAMPPIDYVENNCDFKINITESSENGKLRVELTDLNRQIENNRLSFCLIGIVAEDKNYEIINTDIYLCLADKKTENLSITMDDFTYGDSASVPKYTEPDGTLKKSVTYYEKQSGTKLLKAPTDAGEYTVKVECETKDTIYSGSKDYKINRRAISDITFVPDKNSFTYNGNEQKPNVSAKMNAADLTEKDYTAIYPADMTNAGKKEIIINGIGNFSGSTNVVYNIKKADLTVTVNDVSREYGADNPPRPGVSYGEFVNGEDESVLSGELQFEYDSSINAQTLPGTYTGTAKASGLTSDNYNIIYKNGNVTIRKIATAVSAGTAKETYITAEFDKAVAGLTADNFSIKDNGGNNIAISAVTASENNMSYVLSGRFSADTEYTVSVTLAGALADATNELTVSEFNVTPIRETGGGSVTRYTVTFDSDGGSKVLSRTARKNTAITEPTAPTKEGFDFAGWYTDKKLTEKYDFSAKLTKNITLYAAWKEKDNSANRIILTIGEKAAQVFGQAKTNDVAPKIVNSRTMLPARFVAESLGADVFWNGEKELVTIKGKNLKTNEDVTILIYIGSDIAYVNDEEIKLDSAAFLENDRTYTPVRFISEELGASVEWQQDGQKVIITIPAAEK